MRRSSRSAPTASAGATRDSLRAYFEIDPPSIAAAALSALARAGDITPAAAAEGLARLGIDPEKVDPLET